MKKIFLTAAFLAAIYTAHSQVGIGTKTPSTSTVLDVTGTDRGVLLPRVALTSTTDATTITNGNVEGLTVYNTATVADVTPGYYYWSNAKWNLILNSDKADLTNDAWVNDPANTRVNLATLSDGTTARPTETEFVALDNGNVGIGTETPIVKLDVRGEAIALNGARFISNPLGNQSVLIGEGISQVNFRNVSIGYEAGRNNTLGYQSTFVGSTAGHNNTTGEQNTFIGYEAGNLTTTGSFNTMVGRGARASATGYQNTLIGHSAGNYKTGNNNVAIGYNANVGDLNNIASPIINNSVVIGTFATVSQSNSIVLGNGQLVGIGTSAPTAKLDVVGTVRVADLTGTPASTDVIVTADATTGILKSLPLGGISGLDTTNDAWVNDATNARIYTPTLSDGTTARPANAPSLILKDDGEVTIGDVINNPSSLRFLSVGGTSQFRSSERLGDVTIGSNVRIGQSLNGSNLLFGDSWGANTTASVGSLTTIYAMGSGSKIEATTAGNSIFGWQAGRDLATGSYNTFMGVAAGEAMQSGNGNTYIGRNSGLRATAGDNNVVIGQYSGYGQFSGNPANLTTGTNNVILGSFAGGISSGAGNIVIGSFASVENATDNDQLSIGNLIYGTGLNGSNEFISSGNIGIGVKVPTAKLEVAGKIKAVDVNFSGLPIFADDAAAASLTAGDMYRTATGELRIKL